MGLGTEEREAPATTYLVAFCDVGWYYFPPWFLCWSRCDSWEVSVRGHLMMF